MPDISKLEQCIQHRYARTVAKGPAMNPDPDRSDSSAAAILELPPLTTTRLPGGSVSYRETSGPPGAPAVVLHRRLVTIASERGIAHWLVSASHTSTIAIASVIALTA